MDSLLSNINLGYKNLYWGIAHRSPRNQGGRGGRGKKVRRSQGRRQWRDPTRIPSSLLPPRYTNVPRPRRPLVKVACMNVPRPRRPVIWNVRTCQHRVHNKVSKMCLASSVANKTGPASSVKTWDISGLVSRGTVKWPPRLVGQGEVCLASPA